ncbi:hypothetical protein HK099_007978 [Clydaea vesicula]|uniref:Uncharacterized protein n=1 Tax=Clydaea vesicula TaxID=447962 RepID=A0AAD5U6H3_9FUNG|nr:hypothetical protein HK099_007978 [Clydaea vesicula]
MKNRFSSIDTTSISSTLKQNLVGLRLQNVYDINLKTYLFKFNSQNDKQILLVEAGIRIHTTIFTRDKNNTPSQFCQKLRKHLKNKRLDNVNQIGQDRIIDFTFGTGDNAYHLIFEFYSSGNIILTDHDYKIMAVLRIVELEYKDSSQKKYTGTTKFQIGEMYNLALAQKHQGITMEKLIETLNYKPPIKESIEDELVITKNPKKHKKFRTNVEDIKKLQPLRKFLRQAFGPSYGNPIVEHCLLKSDLDANLLYPEQFNLDCDSDYMHSLLVLLKNADKLIEEISQNPKTKGYVFYKLKENKNEPSGDINEINPLPLSEEALAVSTNYIYTDFQPFLFEQLKELPYLEFNSFDEAVDDYYSKNESQKQLLQAEQAQLQAQKKLNQVRQGHENQVSSFDEVKRKRELQAQAILDNLENVDSLILTIKGLLSQGMDWVDLSELIKEEQRNGNKIAQLVVKLKLEAGQVTIKLRTSEPNEANFDINSESDDDAEEETENNYAEVDIDIFQTAYANASKLFQDKKIASMKQAKTMQTSKKVVKLAEKKILANLDKADHKKNSSTISKNRKPYWFEKFLWFISTENYLVLGGRDTAQNEILIKKYLSKGDIFVYADLEGAAPVIVKNIITSNNELNLQPPPSTPEQPVPPQTLLQAGTMSICQSKAWDSKIITSAWWVKDDQVTRESSVGDSILNGSFAVRGKKNWLPPVSLIYGFGILFKVDEESAARHHTERRPWARDIEQDTMSENKSSSILDLESGGELSFNSGVEENEEKEISVKSFDKCEKKEEIADFNSEKEDVEEGSEEDFSDDEDFEYPDTKISMTKEIFDSKSISSSLATSTADKYNLDEIEPEDKKNSEILNSLMEKPTSKTLTKKVLSAKERRDLKKAQKKSGLNVVEKETKSETANVTMPKEKKEEENSILKQRPPTAVRGKKGKQKKIKEKYGEQDEEEKNLMMEIFSPNKGPQPKGKKEKKLLKEALLKQEEEKKKAQRIEDSKNKKIQEEKSKNLSTSHDGDDNGENDEINEEKNRELKNKLLLEEQEKIDQEINDTFTALNTLTGQPHFEDTIHFAIPVCAPWQSLQKFKYKVKLLPGSLKKGKAAKTAQHFFLNEFLYEKDISNNKKNINIIKKNNILEKINNNNNNNTDDDNEKIEEFEASDIYYNSQKREIEMIKLITDNEFIIQILGKVKVVGGNNVIENKKKGRK